MHTHALRCPAPLRHPRNEAQNVPISRNGATVAITHPDEDAVSLRLRFRLRIRWRGGVMNTKGRQQQRRGGLHLAAARAAVATAADTTAGTAPVAAPVAETRADEKRGANRDGSSARPVARCLLREVKLALAVAA